MSVRDDDVQGYALGVVFGVVAGVLAGVIGLACFRLQHKPAAETAPPPVAQVYFEAGEDSLSWAASDALVHLAEMARESPHTHVVIVGRHEVAGDAQAQVALANRRAERVRHALEAGGVPLAQLIVDKPVRTAGDRDPRGGRRVDVRLR